MTIKLPKYKELATYLGVSEQAVKQYPKVKRELMLHGLKAKTVWVNDNDDPKIKINDVEVDKTEEII